MVFLTDSSSTRVSLEALLLTCSFFLVHGANRLGGSSLLGCVVFGRVAGDEASSYLMKTLSSPSAVANSRLNQVGSHLGMTTTVDPTTKKVTIEFNWGDAGVAQSVVPQQAVAKKVEKKVEKVEEKKVEKKEFTLAEVAKHTAKDDCWVSQFASKFSSSETDYLFFSL